ncbi:hypothetical protein RsS62_53020 [Rhizobium dioscoreae]|uniref:hypothetical protein n=1 Tax=Rhizobium dioscoreae TaxID=2653122 RepID=UPI00127DE49A|nr:hypothetical protein [Rhizobium dioscoreae]GES46050.1 hypothetical protein RsS62_53020 [Rhizobium dioscoreae]
MLRKASARLSEQTEWIDGSTPLKSTHSIPAPSQRLVGKCMAVKRGLRRLTSKMDNILVHISDLFSTIVSDVDYREEKIYVGHKTGNSNRRVG